MGCLLKVHDDSVVAVCDENILGKKFFENDLVVDVDSAFFGGKSASLADVVDAVSGAMSVNAVGNEVVGVKVAHVYRV